MSIEEQMIAIETRLAPIRDRVDAAFAELDRHELHVRSCVGVVEIYTSKTRHVILEALSEIRHIETELASLKAAASTTPSLKTRRATGQSRSRAGRD